MEFDSGVGPNCTLINLPEIDKQEVLLARLTNTKIYLVYDLNMKTTSNMKMTSDMKIL